MIVLFFEFSFFACALCSTSSYTPTPHVRPTTWGQQAAGQARLDLVHKHGLEASLRGLAQSETSHARGPYPPHEPCQVWRSCGKSCISSLKMLVSGPPLHRMGTHILVGVVVREAQALRVGDLQLSGHGASHVGVPVLPAELHLLALLLQGPQRVCSCVIQSTVMRGDSLGLQRPHI